MSAAEPSDARARFPLVLHVISDPGGIGGAETVVRALALAAEQRAWRSLVVNPFASGEKDGLAEYFSPVVYLSRSTTRVTQLRSARAFVERAIREHRPTLVHVHLFHAAVLSATLPAEFRHRSVLTHHHGALYAKTAPRTKGLLDRWATSRFPHVVVASPAVRSFLETVYRLPAGSVSVIPNGWSGAPRPRSAGEGARIVCVGNLRWEKGHDVLLSAFARVRRDLPDARLTIVGDGPRHEALEALVKRLDLSGAVTFTGRVDDIFPYLAESDLFVQSAVEETFGIAVLEAMAAGLPVVATRTGGLEELVAEGSTGILVASGDAQALAAAMVALIDDGSRRATMGQAARERAGGFTMATTVDRYYQLYGELARR